MLFSRHGAQGSHSAMVDAPIPEPREPVENREHPLLSKRTGVAVALLAFPAIGLGLISVQAVALGFIVSVIGTIGIIWLYLKDFAHYQSRDENIQSSLTERWIAVIILIVTMIAPICEYRYIVDNGIVKTNSKQEIDMARRWIDLSNDILADVHSATFDFRMPSTTGIGMTQGLRSRLWEEESQRSIESLNSGIASLKQKYSGRLAQAQIEMKNRNISMTQGIIPLERPLVNTFSFEAWASKLGGEGRQILMKNGETP